MLIRHAGAFEGERLSARMVTVASATHWNHGAAVQGTEYEAASPAFLVDEAVTFYCEPFAFALVSYRWESRPRVPLRIAVAELAAAFPHRTQESP
jgi:hypothetical protein